jgi:cell division protein FtsL
LLTELEKKEKIIKEQKDKIRKLKKEIKDLES